MAKLTSWADFFKFTTDVIDEDYHHNKNFSVKAKTTSNDGLGEYSLKVEQSKPESGESSNAMELKVRLKQTDVVTEMKLKNGGKFSVEREFGLAKLGEHFEGWTYSLTGNFIAGSTLDKSTFASALKVKRSNLDAKVTYDHSKKTDLEAEVAYHPEEQSKVIVGGNVSLNLKDAKVNKHTFGVKHA